MMLIFLSVSPDFHTTFDLFGWTLLPDLPTLTAIEKYYNECHDNGKVSKPYYEAPVSRLGRCCRLKSSLNSTMTDHFEKWPLEVHIPASRIMGHDLDKRSHSWERWRADHISTSICGLPYSYQLCAPNHHAHASSQPRRSKLSVSRGSRQ